VVLVVGTWNSLISVFDFYCYTRFLESGFKTLVIVILS
jgi:hypothetical protein